MRIPLWIKLLWTLWVNRLDPGLLAAIWRAEFLYFCDLGNLLILVRAVAGELADFFWQACSLLLFQSLFVPRSLRSIAQRTTLDWRDGIYVRSAHCPRGSPIEFVFMWSHLRCCCGQSGGVGYDPRGWKYQTVTAWIVVPFKLFVASAIRCELGAGAVLSSTTCDARAVVSTDVSDRCSRCHLLPHSSNARLVEGPCV